MFDDIIIRIVLGLIIGFFVGLTSIGSGVIVLPILTVLLKDPITAIGTTTLYAFLTKITALFYHVKLKTINWKISSFFLIGAIPSTITAANYVSSKNSDLIFKKNLEYSIIIIILISILSIFFNIIRKKSNYEKDEKFNSSELTNVLSKKILSIGSGIFCGFLVGSTSIGGGIIVIPLLIILFNIKTKYAVGSSIFLALIMTMITSFIYGLKGQQEILTAIIMALGSIIGVYFGSKLTTTIPDKFLKIIVLFLMIFGFTILSINTFYH